MIDDWFNYCRNSYEKIQRPRSVLFFLHLLHFWTPLCSLPPALSHGFTPYLSSPSRLVPRSSSLIILSSLSIKRGNSKLFLKWFLRQNIKEINDRVGQWIFCVDFVHEKKRKCPLHWAYSIQWFFFPFSFLILYCWRRNIVFLALFWYREMERISNFGQSQTLNNLTVVSRSVGWIMWTWPSFKLWRIECWNNFF